MGQATLGGTRFRLDPDSISWRFSVKTKVTYTVGGKVVQVYGSKIEDMTISGSFGKGGFDEQQRFVDAMVALAEAQAAPTSPPHRFTFPVKGWDFQVYIKALATPDGPRSMSVRPEIVNPKFILTLFIVEENAGLTRVATDNYIQRLTEGIGWTPNEFNGATSYAALQDQLGHPQYGTDSPGSASQAAHQGHGPGGDPALPGSVGSSQAAHQGHGSDPALGGGG